MSAVNRGRRHPRPACHEAVTSAGLLPLSDIEVSRRPEPVTIAAAPRLISQVEETARAPGQAPSFFTDAESFFNFPSRPSALRGLVSRKLFTSFQMPPMTASCPKFLRAGRHRDGQPASRRANARYSALPQAPPRRRGRYAGYLPSPARYYFLCKLLTASTIRPATAGRSYAPSASIRAAGQEMPGRHHSCSAAVAAISPLHAHDAISPYISQYGFCSFAAIRADYYIAARIPRQPSIFAAAEQVFSRPSAMATKKVITEFPILGQTFSSDILMSPSTPPLSS